MQATSPPRAAETHADAPKSQTQSRPLSRQHRQVGHLDRHLRRTAGIAVAVLGLVALIAGSAISTSAAEAQVKQLAIGARALSPPTDSASDSASESASESAGENGPEATAGPGSESNSANADGRSQAVNGGIGVEPESEQPINYAPSTTSNSTAEWSAMFGGDSLLTRPRGGANPFDRQQPLLRSADLAVVNVETAISDSTFKEPKQYNFKSPVSFATMMGEAGVDVGSLANNHSMDFGDQGMLDTVDALTDAGVTPVGAGVNRAAALAPSYHSIKGLRVAVIGASQVIPDPGWIATHNTIGVAAAGKDLNDATTLALTDTIRSARVQSDVVIVFMHWGNERAVCPTDLQQRTAKVLHAAGAAVVVGAHPHVLQPVVRSAGNVTAYSLGNFVWDPRSGITADTGILEVRFRGPAVASVVFHPHHLDGNGWAAPVSNAQAQERILNQAERNCTGADGTGSLDR